jgi:invasion protein IalB
MPNIPANRLGLIGFALALTMFLADSAQAQQTPVEPVATFGDWAKACETGESGKKECFLFQNITTQDGSRGILHMTVIKIPEANNPIMVITVPLGIFLPRGLALSIDGAKPTRIQVQVCSTNGCQSQFQMPDAVLGSFKAGLEGTMQMFDPSGKEVKVPFSLKGFTKALASLG